MYVGEGILPCCNRLLIINIIRNKVIEPIYTPRCEDKCPIPISMMFLCCLYILSLVNHFQPGASPLFAFFSNLNAQKLLFPMDGKSFSPSNLLNRGLVQYSQAVRIQLATLNTSLSIPSSNFLACSFFSGMITTASPSSFSNATSNPLICWGENPTAIRSGQTTLSYLTASLCTSSGVSLKLITFPTPLLVQFFTPFLTTSSRTSQRVIDFAYVHFPRATPTSPTPAFTTSTSLPLNRSLSRMTYRATITSISHRRSPSNSWGKISRSEMVAFILKPQCRMMSRLRRRRISLGEDPPCDQALFLEEVVPPGWPPIYHYIINSDIHRSGENGEKKVDNKKDGNQ